MINGYRKDNIPAMGEIFLSPTKEWRSCSFLVLDSQNNCLILEGGDTNYETGSVQHFVWTTQEWIKKGWSILK